MAGFETRKPRSREGHKVKREAAAEKRRRGRVGTTGVLAAAARSSRRAKDPQSMETVQTTLQEVDVTTQKRLVDWSNRGNPVDVLKNSIDPQYGRVYAVQTQALRTDRPLEEVTAAVAESEAGTAANVLSRKASAAKRRKEGYSKTYKLLSGRKQKIVRTGAEVRKQQQRRRMISKMPARERPTYVSQTKSGHGWEFSRGRGQAPAYVRAEGVRSQAEINAQQQRVTGPCSRGDYRMTIPKSLFSGRALLRMGFPKKNGKPKRAFDFKGPTAKDDARAFDKKLMGWLKKWKKGVGPPPQPRKP